jgi:nitrite reductase/ring-hydroxylating ferredoxin subunit/uncharacterized membrane protein
LAFSKNNLNPGMPLIRNPCLYLMNKITMRSKASIKNHPLHPILVGFPVAFFAATLFFDILALLYPDMHMEQTAFYLNIGGIVTGLLAAVPGIIDYRYTLPPDSSAKKRAVKHGLINTFVITLFVLSIILKENQIGNKPILISIEAIGVILLTIAGWLGATMVIRNQIGIDIRYAGAGKWKEVYINSNEKTIPVATTEELKVNQMKLVHLNGKRIVVARGDDNYSAFDDHCPHRGGSLAAGTLICNTVQCPWHGSQFNIQSGSIISGPAANSITVYKLRVEGNIVYLEANDN